MFYARTSTQWIEGMSKLPRLQGRFDFRNRVVCALLFGMIATSAVPAGNAPRPEALIKWRQSAFQVLAWNTARIKSALAAGHDPREITNAAEALSAVANAGLADLFAVGTDQGRGWRETTARQTVFADAAKFRALSDEFARETRVLATRAASGDDGAVTAQFARVVQACKACHDRYRDTD